MQSAKSWRSRIRTYDLLLEEIAVTVFMYRAIMPFIRLVFLNLQVVSLTLQQFDHCLCFSLIKEQYGFEV